MKVLLIQDVDNLGLAGEVKDVATGYGRNYLIPQGMAVLATQGALGEADLHRRRAAERRQRLADELAALAEAISQTTLVFEAKAGATGRLYGSVTSGDIADKLAEAVARDIDRRRIIMEAPIKDLGTHTVTLRLSTDVAADVVVVVESIDGEDASEAVEAIAVEESEIEVAATESLETPEPLEADEPAAEE
jgi:large subunit ribosomal protein L9